MLFEREVYCLGLETNHISRKPDQRGYFRDNQQVGMVVCEPLGRLDMSDSLKSFRMPIRILVVNNYSLRARIISFLSTSISYGIMSARNLLNGQSPYRVFPLIFLLLRHSLSRASGILSSLSGGE